MEKKEEEKKENTHKVCRHQHSNVYAYLQKNTHCSLHVCAHKLDAKQDITSAKMGVRCTYDICKNEAMEVGRNLKF